MKEIADVTSETTDLVGVSTRGDYYVPEDTGHGRGPGSRHTEDRQSGQSQLGHTLHSFRQDQDKAMAKGLSRKRKVFILVSCTSALFLSACAASLLTTFFATVAETKGLTAIHVGFIFGIFEMGIFCTSPFFGSFLTTIGTKFAFLSGILVAGVCNVLFGILNYSSDGTTFLVLCLLVRLVEAFGVSAFSTASLSLASSYFPESVGSVLAILETGIGVGYMLGPVIGGALFELGGFGLPFYTIGCLVLLNGICIFISLPTSDYVKTKSNQTMTRLLRSPVMYVLLASVLCGMFGIITLDSLLAKDVDNFGLSPVDTGLLFILLCGMFTASLSLMGYLTDKKNIQTPLIVGGHLICAAGAFLLGPNAFFPGFPFNLGSVCAGLILMGMSLSTLLVPSMKCMVTEALDMGYNDDLDTYAMVSGVFYASYHLGGFLGPVVSGVVAETYSYQAAFSVIGLMNLFMVVLSGVFFYAKRFWARHGHDEYKVNGSQITKK